MQSESDERRGEGEVCTALRLADALSDSRRSIEKVPERRVQTLWEAISLRRGVRKSNMELSSALDLVSRGSELSFVWTECCVNSAIMDIRAWKGS